MLRLLGVSNVTAYTLRLHPDTRRTLSLYEDEGFVTLIPFQLPGDDQPNDPNERAIFLKRHLWQKRRYELVPYNDCFYRHLLDGADFVVPLDVDEMILPTSGVGRTWDDLVKAVQKAEPAIFDE
jgi:hypothetical protein